MYVSYTCRIVSYVYPKSFYVKGNKTAYLGFYCRTNFYDNTTRNRINLKSVIKTQEKINEAKGGILFIDEAYSLAQGHKAHYDFGAEAIATLIKAMEDYRDNLIIIFAGYDKEMQDKINLMGLSEKYNPISILTIRNKKY